MNDADLHHRVDAIREEFTGRLGFAARHLASGEEILINAKATFPTASVFKIAVMVEVFAQAAEGRLDLSRRCIVNESDQIGGTGVLLDFAAGLAPTVLDLTTLMITVSDNTATNMLIDLLGGVSAVNNRLHTDLGLEGINLHSRIDFQVIGDDVRRLAEATPRGLLDLMSRLATGQIIDADSSRLMIEIMSKQAHLDQVPRYMDYHRYRDQLGLPDDFKIACKTGVFPGVRADAGAIFTPKGTIAYAAMTEGAVDMSNAVENEASVTNGRLGRLVLEHWWPEAIDRGILLTSRYL